MNTLQEHIYKKHFNILKSELSENTKNVKVFLITKGNNAINNLIALTERKYIEHILFDDNIKYIIEIHKIKVKL